MAPAPRRAVGRLEDLADRAPRPESFSSRLRSPTVTARVGLWLGVCFGVAFVTGLWSHYQQDVPGWFTLPTRPVQLYRVTQGLHVIAGTAAVPLLLVKLWSVYPKLFERFDLRHAGRLGLQLLERASIFGLVSAAIFQLATGLANISHWYPWSFSFRGEHYAVAWVAIGALLLHVAVKLPLIRTALTSDVDDEVVDTSGIGVPTEKSVTRMRAGTVAGAASNRSPGLSRRGLLRTTWLAAGVAVLATAGATVPWLRKVSLLAIRDGDGPQGLPVNRSAYAAGVLDVARDPAYRLSVVNGAMALELSRDDLAAMPQTTVSLPIACVEGWSAMAVWRGVRLRDLLKEVGRAGGDVHLSSLQQRGAFGSSTLPSQFVDDDLTLIALEVNGQVLDLDHGYPCRLIAPNRPGVRQTKWLSRIEVLA